MFETLDIHAECSVEETEYLRLLGFPPGYVPTGRVEELAAWARGWFAGNSRPWAYLREATVQAPGGVLRIDGVQFNPRPLREILVGAGARRAALVAVSAGRACEEYAAGLWKEGRPDEYFFLEVFGSAVVERLVAEAGVRICSLAERDGLVAAPHYSPGFNGSDVADQNELFGMIDRGRTRPWPEQLEVLPSGMLRPKKSQLAVFGLAGASGPFSAPPRPAPCARCFLPACRYRRSPRRPAVIRTRGAHAGTPEYADSRI
jgi:hypothetical protein